MININSDKYVISAYDQNMLNSLKEYVELEQDTVDDVTNDELTGFRGFEGDNIRNKK